MTGEDIDQLFALLEIYRPGDRHLSDKKLRSAWLLVLKPFSREEVKAAVAAYFRESKYWPDPSDIAMRCPARLKKPRLTAAAAYEAEVEWLWGYAERLTAEYHNAGLMTPDEAKNLGWTDCQLTEACREAGL